MFPYIILFTLVLVPAFKKHTRINMTWYYTITGILLIFTGLRDMIGGYDVYIYAAIYEATVSRIFEFNGFEYGFKLLYVSLKSLNDDRHFMFFSIASIFFVSQSYVLKKYSPLFYLSLFIIFCKFFLMSFIYLRQELAMVVCWLAIPYVIKKQYVMYFGFMLIAFLMHKSALLFLPFYFFSMIRFSKLQIILITTATLFLSLTPLVDQFIISLGDGGLEEASDTVDRVVKYHSQSKGINPFYLVESFMLLGVLLFFKNKFYENSKTIALANGFFLYILVTVFSVKNGAFIRFNWYFLVFVAIMLSYVVFYIKDEKIKQLVNFIIILYFSLLFFRLLINWDFGDLMPYKTIFEEGSRGGMWDYMEYRKTSKDYGF